MALLAVLVYGLLFALVYAWAVVWLLERRDRRFRQGAASFTDAFLPGAFVLIFVYIANIVVLVHWPSSAVMFDLTLLGGLAAFAAYRELLYRTHHRAGNKKLRAEARLLERHMKRDPGNAALFERASEVYEELGERALAVEAARIAAELDPTVRNSWRFRELLEGEEDPSAGRKRGDGAP
ncbi:MAG: hypothetical protein ACYC2I_06020 [Elusimicrobiales bacterium]